MESPFVFLVVVVPVGVWMLVTGPRPGRPRRMADAVALWVLPVVFVGLFCWSQLRADVFTPPIEEWAIACALVGIGLLLVALGRDLVNWSNAARTPSGPAIDGRARPGGVWRGLAVGSGLLLSCCLACCAPLTKFTVDEPFDDEMPGALLQSHARPSEWSPLPAGALVIATECFNLGSHGKCNDVKVLSPVGGVTRDKLVARIIANYRAHGWPLEAQGHGESYEGCRPVIGILRWADHCMQVIAKEGTDSYSGAPDIRRSVNVYIV